ncbi:hypothetical protein [Rhodovarius crocodyli]|nr:hypothetical protein [Rhodovarius crocodyli]
MLRFLRILLTMCLLGIAMQACDWANRPSQFGEWAAKARQAYDASLRTRP